MEKIAEALVEVIKIGGPEARNIAIAYLVMRCVTVALIGASAVLCVRGLIKAVARGYCNEAHDHQTDCDICMEHDRRHKAAIACETCREHARGHKEALDCWVCQGHVTHDLRRCATYVSLLGGVCADKADRCTSNPEQQKELVNLCATLTECSKKMHAIAVGGGET